MTGAFKTALGILIVGLLVAAAYGSYLIKKDGEACAASGGVQVRTYDGFSCIRVNERPPMSEQARQER